MELKAFELAAQAMLFAGDLLTGFVLFTTAGTFLFRIAFWQELQRFIRIGWFAASGMIAAGVGILAKYMEGEELLALSNGRLFSLSDGEISLILFGCLLVLLVTMVIPPLHKKEEAPAKKSCPHCSTQIYAQATVCKSCRRVLDWSVMNTSRV